MASVDVVFDESLALEGRAAYYDATGAMVDMIQSHMLEVMSLFAMEPPATLQAEDVRDAKAQILRATRIWNDDPAAYSRRARYTAGDIDGRQVPAYVSTSQDLSAGAVDARPRLRWERLHDPLPERGSVAQHEVQKSERLMTGVVSRGGQELQCGARRLQDQVPRTAELIHAGCDAMPRTPYSWKPWICRIPRSRFMRKTRGTTRSDHCGA